jgi:GR25 family glycosyltransferase involved in LPS biosynthesis
MTAKEAYDDLINELFRFDNNPTYELCAITLDNKYGISTTINMEKAGYIKYIGKNHNGHVVYKIR